MYLFIRLHIVPGTALTLLFLSSIHREFPVLFCTFKYPNEPEASSENILFMTYWLGGEWLYISIAD